MMKKRCFILIAAILLCMLFPASVSANSAEPPGFTVIVLNPPPGLSLSVQFPDGTQTTPVDLLKEEKGWEAYYRFFYYSGAGGPVPLDGVVLTVEYEGGSFQCEMPAGSFELYNNLLTLDISAQTIVNGQPAWRVPALVGLRLLLTLLLEGLVFFFFGYRKRRSWLIFAGVNLVTQGLLNVLLTGPQFGAYWLFGYLFGEIFIFAAEMIAFAFFLQEFSKKRAVLVAFAANSASLIIGGLLISYLPI